MSNTLTLRTRQVLDQGSVSPNIILDIDGVTNFFGALEIQETIKVGMTGLVVGDPIPGESVVWKIGGLTNLLNQSNLISFQLGTSNKIKTSLNVDKGFGESITSMQIALIDQDEEITDIISPGVVVDDILGRKCRVWYGFNQTSFKDDYILIFRGVVDSVESGPGQVLISISHPDTKKKASIFTKATNQLNGALNSSDTTITVDSTSDFLTRVLGPDGITYDSMFKTYIKIDNEIIQYTGKTATTFTGCTRASLGTTNTSHNDNANVESIIRLDGDAINLALKLMFSGLNDFYKDGIAIKNYLRVSSTETISNTIFFEDYDIELETGISVGDYITTSGATNGANNVSAKQVLEIIKTDLGSYITIDGVSFVEELDTSALLSIRSKYDVWPDGLKMLGEDVDVQGHLKVFNRFLSNFNYDFILEDTIENAKDFLSEQIYNPAAAFSIPKGTRSSCGYHLGPIPGDTIYTLDNTNVLNPSQLKITRTTFKNFANTVIYKLQKAIGDDTFLRGIVGFSQTSRDRIPVGNKSMVVESQGLRSWQLDNPTISDNGETLATEAINRKLKKFKFGAEFINGIKVNLSTGINFEVDDIVLIDMASLQISDIQNSTRSGEPRLFQIVNYELDLLKGIITIDVVDPNFDKDNRYGLVAPSSQIKSGVSTTQFLIEPAYYTGLYGIQEYKKWDQYIGTGVRISNQDYTTTDTSTLTAVSGNLITVSPALSFTPASGYILSIDSYNTSSEFIHAKYAFMSTGSFDDGTVEYKMI